MFSERGTQRDESSRNTPSGHNTHTYTQIFRELSSLCVTRSENIWVYQGYSSAHHLDKLEQSINKCNQTQIKIMKIYNWGTYS